MIFEIDAQLHIIILYETKAAQDIMFPLPVVWISDRLRSQLSGD